MPDRRLAEGGPAATAARHLVLFGSLLAGLSLLFSGANAEDVPAPHGVRWRSWGPEAFADARRLNRPILLDLTAEWCHWCHVMDRDVYADSLLAATIQQRFIPIRVDRDRHPEIDRRYNAGGWPSTVFLSPDGQVIVGDTYITPDRMGPLLLQVSRYYRNNEESFRKKVEEHRKQQEAEHAKEPTSAVLNELVLRDVAEALLAPNVTDPLLGGVGHDPKFPSPDPIRFALRAGPILKDRDLMRYARTTLDAMRRGAIYDRVGGGFHRYSAGSDWNRPEYEKLLDLNAELADVYLLAYETFHQEEDLATARATLGYLERVLLDPAHDLFRASQDADALVGQKGSYYVWTAPEFDRSVPPSALPLLRVLFGFDDRDRPDRPLPLYRVVKLEEAARRAGVRSQDAPRLLEDGLEALRRARMRRSPPRVSDLVPVDGNAMTVSALLHLAELSPADSARARSLARRVASALLANGCSPGEPVPHWLGPPDGAPRLLDDQVRFGEVLLAMHGATGEGAWLEQAREAADVLLHSFRSGEDGALADRIPGPSDEGLLAEPTLDIEENGRAALLLLDLGEASGDAFYRRQALTLLRTFAPRYQEYSYFAGAFALATYRLLDGKPPVEPGG